MHKPLASIAAVLGAAASLGIAVMAAPQKAPPVPQKQAAAPTVVVYKSPT